MQIRFDRDTSVYIPTRAVQSNRIQQSCKTDLHDLDYKIRHHQRKKTKKRKKGSKGTITSLKICRCPNSK